MSDTAAASVPLSCLSAALIVAVWASLARLTMTSGYVGNSDTRHFPAAADQLVDHREIPRARAASNRVRATCSAFSVAEAPTGFAS